MTIFKRIKLLSFGCALLSACLMGIEISEKTNSYSEEDVCYETGLTQRVQIVD
ncbi:MAG: hypothetical protein WCT20_02950 [Candidatus Babeliales bacterium]